METLIIIALAIGSLIWNALQKRKQEEEEAKPWLPPMPKGSVPGQRQPPTQTPTQAPLEKPRSWEEELRRLLQGEPAEPSPPPVIIRPLPPPAPPPLPRRAQAPARAPEEGKPDLTDGDAPVTIPALARSAEAIHRGRDIEATIAERLRKVDAQLLSHKTVLDHHEKSQEISRALGLLRDRPSQRAAIIASIVLGPPKSLES
jgi:hypothetical protein